MPRAKDVDVSLDEYYHLYTRGVEKKSIFLDERDYARFIFCLLHFPYDTNFYHLDLAVTRFLKTGLFSSKQDTFHPDDHERLADITAFALMPNHVHIIAREKQEGGIAHTMKKVLGGYAKYFNAKYKASGHVFQGAYNAVHISDNDQLLHTSAYVHRNPRELHGWKNREMTYPWSSFQDYTTTNRWGPMLSTSDILEQFNAPRDYQKFVETSPAKDC